MSRHPSYPPTRRPALLLLALVAAFGWVLGGTSLAQADEGYVPPVQTTCGVELGVSDGRLEAVVGAGTPGNVPTFGEVAVRFTHNRETIKSVVVRYRGQRVVVDGPRIPEPSGTYGVVMRFTPDDDGVRSSCSAQTNQPYAVLGASGTADPDPTDEPGGDVLGNNGAAAGDVSDDGGLLPDTGGPALWGLALGVLLVAIGVPLLRRRRTGPTSPA